MSDEEVLIPDDLLAAIEEAIKKPDGNDLSSGVPACLAELEACRRGRAFLDHLWGRIIDELADAREAWETVEARCAANAREDGPKGMTATELKGRITEEVNRTPSYRQTKDTFELAKRRKEKVTRWLDSMDSRQQGAQSAQKGHEHMAKYGGAG